MYSAKIDIVYESLRQIEKSILLLIEWNKDISSADDYYLSPEGMKNLAASCMLIEAIGEAFRKIDTITEGSLLKQYPDVPWHAVIGMRNRIAHGYFDIDAEIVYTTVTEDLPPLLEATRFLINSVKGM